MSPFDGLGSLRRRLAEARSDSLLRNSVYIMAVTVVTSILGFVFWLVAARRFSASEVGLSAALVSAMTLVSLLSNLGINTALVQMLPGRRNGEEWSATMNAGLLVGTVSGILAGLAAGVLLPLISGRFDILQDSVTYLPIFVVGVVMTTATNLLDYACIAERRSEKTLLRNTVFSVVKIPLLVLPFIVALGTFGIFVSWVAATAITVAVAAAMIPGLRRGYRLSARGLGGELRRLRTYVAGHHSINIGNFAPWWLLPVFVTVQVSTAATAYFYATWRICGVLFLISPSVASALTAEGAHSPAELWAIAGRSMRSILKMLIPAAIGLALIGNWLLAAFGSDYASEALPLLLLFCLASIPAAGMDVWIAVLRVEGRLRFGSWLQLGTAGLALALSWVLLPPLGITGAGVAWLASRLLGVALVAWDYRRQQQRRDLIRPASPQEIREELPAETDLDGVPAVSEELAAAISDGDRSSDAQGPPASRQPTGSPETPGPINAREQWLLRDRARRAWRSESIGLLAPIAFVVSIGVLALGFAEAAARSGEGSKELLFWIGIVLIVAPVLIRLAGGEASRRERVLLVVTLGVGLFLAKVLYSPTRLVFSDEYVELRNVLDVLSAGHLYSFNPLLPVASSYPGLGNVAVALVQMSGLPVATAAFLAVGAARVVLMLALFLLVERISGSARIAAFGAALYVANPNFLYWSAQFKYESLALPLALFTLYLVVRRADGHRSLALSTLIGLAATAVAVTHHLSSYFLAGVLVLWTGAAYVLRRGGRRIYVPIWPAAITLAAIGAWLALVASGTNYYLGGIAANAGSGVVDTLSGSDSTRALFGGSVEVAPTWERALSVGSVVLTLTVLALACGLIWKSRRAVPLLLIPLAVALVYPLLLPLRFIGSAAETANRSSEFLFLGVGVVIAVASVWISRRAGLRRVQLLVATGALVIVLGGVAVAWQYSSRLPEDPAARVVPYELGGRAISADEWAALHLRGGGRVATDLLNRLGVATYGRQRPLYAPDDGVSAWQILAPAKVDSAVRDAIREGKVAYVMVDQRLHRGVPPSGYYFDRGEPRAGHYRRPISRAILGKFDNLAGASRIYDNGALQIYEVRGLR